MQGHPSLHSIQAKFINVEVTDTQGRRPSFVPWFGALAGVLLPEPGTWRLFLQMKVAGRVVTAPYTLLVAS